MSDGASGFFTGFVFTMITAAIIPNPSASRAEITWAESACEANGGLVSLRPNGRIIMPSKARCKNGAEFKLIIGEERRAEQLQRNRNG